jgi:glycosyltransferase involved in cell wall biosynthesis
MSASASADEPSGSIGLPTVPFGIDWAPRRETHASKVGVIMRTRNRPLLLPRGLASVTDQSLDDWHLVVVNHGGEQAPVERAVADAAALARGRIEVLHLDPGGGMERASNAGLARIDADYVAVHDDDDTWLPDFLERTTSFLDEESHAGYGAVVTHITQRWERIEGGDVVHVIDNELNTDDTFIDVQRLLGWNRFLPIGMLVRSEAVELLGGFNETLHVIGDWEFNLRLAAITDIGVVPEALARHHLRATGSETHYDNTLTASEGAHLQTDAVLRAALLRRYLDADPTRLGLLVALSHDDEGGRQHAEQVKDLLERIDWRTTHLASRVNDAHDRIMRMEETFDVLGRRLDQLQAAVTRAREVARTVTRPLRSVERARVRWRARGGGSR